MHRPRRALRHAIALVAGFTLATSSCSFFYVRGAPRGAPKQMSFVECRGSFVAPLLDTVAGLSPVFFIYLPSAIYGFVKLSNCSRAERELNADIARLGDTPEGLRPDVTLAAVTVELAQHGDTLRVGETVKAQGVALTAVGNKIMRRLFLWSSSDPTIVGVDTSGAVQALTAGSATISALTGGVTGTRRVVVVP